MFKICVGTYTASNNGKQKLFPEKKLEKLNIQSVVKVRYSQDPRRLREWVLDSVILNCNVIVDRLQGRCGGKTLTNKGVCGAGPPPPPGWK